MSTKSVGQLRILEFIGKPELASILKEKGYELSGAQNLKSDDGSQFYSKKVIQHDSNLLEHILFSLKYEGYNLFVLSAGLRNIPHNEMLEAYHISPNGTLTRKAAMLWEYANQQALNIQERTTSKYIDFFDPDKYITGVERKNSKWRVNFNGIGDLNWCPVIQRTNELDDWLKKDLLTQSANFAKEADERLLSRAMEWSFLSETKGSFAIENEKPSYNKMESFVTILKRIKDNVTIDEECLCSLQNEVVSMPLDKAVSYRHSQNWLQLGSGRGPSSITYAPPEPSLVDSLMKGIESVSNQTSSINPICLASAISYGFVFVHPFMDGNGRLSRCLIHHGMNKAKEMPQNLILPISVAMKNNESDYLKSLKGFSIPARKLCNVTWIDQDDFRFDWESNADLFFRYPDLTEQTVFIMDMTQYTLTELLESEIQFLKMYDKVYAEVNEQYDVRNKVLASLVTIALKSNGSVSNKKRKKYADYISNEALEFLESSAKNALTQRAGANDDGERGDSELNASSHFNKKLNI